MSSPDGLPKFDSPPVVETVLSAQFNRLPKFSAALVGWFWKAYLGEEWKDATDVPRIEDQFEKFTEDALWPVQTFSFASVQVYEPRVQITSADGSRMIQVQDSRFILNWRKQGDAPYPSYAEIVTEFRTHFESFRIFVDETMHTSPDLNQWEITYVNQIPRGQVWTSVSDWSRILPQFNPPSLPIPAMMESRGGDWRFVLGENLGRLYVSVRHGKTKGADEFIGVTLTARGPVDTNGELDLKDGLDFGHVAITKAFVGITSEEAQRTWKRRA